MMQWIKEVIADTFPDVQFEPIINIAHNYAAWVHHKDIDRVMENQQDLVKIKVALSPIAVIKG